MRVAVGLIPRLSERDLCRAGRIHAEPCRGSISMRGQVLVREPWYDGRLQHMRRTRLRVAMTMMVDLRKAVGKVAE